MFDQDSRLWEFVGYMLAALLMLFASIVHGRSRIILCIISWLSVILQGAYLFLVMGFDAMSRQYPRNDTFDVNAVRIGCTVLIAAFTLYWSYRLLRKPRANENAA